MRSTILNFVAVASFALLWPSLYAQVTVGVFDPGNLTMTKVENQDLMGSNLRYFVLKPGETCQTCIDSCLKDPNCKAYTYTKPGYQAPNGICFLKSAVPVASTNNNCISGVKSSISNVSQMAIPGFLILRPIDAPSFFASASVELLAKQLNTGQTLGNQSMDSKDFDFHFSWAKKMDGSRLKQDLLDKFNTMVDLKVKEGTDATADWYALVCSTWANYDVDFGSAGNSKDLTVHKNWAVGQSASVLKDQIKLRLNKIFASYGIEVEGKATGESIKVAAWCNKMLTIPGLVIGMSNFAKDGGSKFSPPDYLSGLEVHTIYDYEDGFFVGTSNKYSLEYFKLPAHDNDDPYLWSLPPGVVLGLSHSSYSGPSEKIFGYMASKGPEYLGGNKFKKENGGDLGGSSGSGWYWYESTSQGFSDWSIIQCLPRGTVVSLKHSINQKGKQFVWNGITYDAANPDISPPQGFLRRHYGDMGAPTNQGYYWYEKITDPPLN